MTKRHTDYYLGMILQFLNETEGLDPSLEEWLEIQEDAEDVQDLLERMYEEIAGNEEDDDD